MFIQMRLLLNYTILDAKSLSREEYGVYLNKLKNHAKERFYDKIDSLINMPKTSSKFSTARLQVYMIVPFYLDAKMFSRT
jgi:hypothetical protein